MEKHRKRTTKTRGSSSRVPAISASVICFNEEQRIRKCLESIGWCDEIVVVDSGSTDKTIEIVKSFPQARILHRNFDTFKEQKNFAVDQCNNNWILSLDADEVLPTTLREEIQGLNFDKAGYRFRRANFLACQEIRFGNWNPDYTLRLFQRSQCRWGGTNPHESIVTEGKVEDLHAPLLHFSYETREDYITRSRKYALMMVDYMRENGKSSTRAEACLHFIGNFFKGYLLRRGFLDGSDGLYLAWHGAKASYLKHSELAKRS